MKKFFYVAVLALAMTSCGGNNAANANAEKVATEVIPNEPAK